jgi:ABC-type nitrate/sulfonate/bicarbonate transport system substrate-binding protein
MNDVVGESGLAGQTHRAAWVSRGGDLEKTELKLGFIPLTDCAPLVVASTRGYFEKYGLNVTLQRESSWANIRDKVSLGMLDGGHMLAAMPIASTLGVGPTRTPMVTALSLDLNGNAVTISNALYERMMAVDSKAAENAGRAARALKQVIDEDKSHGAPPMTFATVFPFSSHNYLLRFWMAAGGIDPECDVNLIVVPPPQMPNHLAEGSIAGYCVGEPWNTYAVDEGVGHTLLTSYEIWNNHPEKVFGVTREWAERYPNSHKAVLMALLEAARWLDGAAHRSEAAEILAGDKYIAALPQIIKPSITGMVRYSRTAPPVSHPDFNVFERYAATFPWRSHAEWLITQMYRWGQVDNPVNIRQVAESVYRPELYREVADALCMPYPTVDYKSEGTHPETWTLSQASAAISMGADRFMDGTSYDPSDLVGYLQSFAIQHPSVSIESLADMN